MNKPLTRAARLRDKVKVRLASNAAGPEIGRILAENGVLFPDADWSDVFPYWLIATVEDEVIGCVQVLPAKPVGCLKFLYVKPSAGFKNRALSMRALLISGMATIHGSGAQWLCGDVNPGKFRNVLAKLNFVQMDETSLMVKRLT